MQRLSEKIQDRVIALNQPVEWPPRSPDLTPCDFFLWGYLKNKVYRTPPENLAILRRRIVEETNILRRKPEFVRNSFAAMLRKTNLCLQRNGRHVESL